jgi:predicted DNA-binding antitoxin AbrB/MazE fold protein
MTTTIRATFENGVLTPKQPLALAEGTEVRLTITPMDENGDPLGAVIGIGESGRVDGADSHDHYIYGTRRRRR